MNVTGQPADHLPRFSMQAISYSGMLLNLNLDGMFPQPEAARARGPLQLVRLSRCFQTSTQRLATSR